MIYIGSRINPRYIARLNQGDRLYLWQRYGDNNVNDSRVTILGKLPLKFSITSVFIMHKKFNTLLQHKEHNKRIYVFELVTFLALGPKYWRRIDFLEIGDLLHLNWGLLGKFAFNIIIRIIKKHNIGVVVTSHGFKAYLESYGIHKIALKLNVPRVERLPVIKRVKKDKLCISYIGMFRYLNNWAYLKGILQDSAEYKMFGKFPEELSKADYVSDYIGDYQKSNIDQLYLGTDIVFAYYSGENEKYLLPNKFYEAILFCRPLIYSAHNYYSQIIEENNLGVCLTGELEKDRIKLEKLMNNYDYYFDQIYCYREKISNKFIV